MLDKRFPAPATGGGIAPRPGPPASTGWLSWAGSAGVLTPRGAHVPRRSAVFGAEGWKRGAVGLRRVLYPILCFFLAFAGPFLQGTP